MRLEDAPILRFYHLTIDEKDKDKFEEEGVRNMTTSIKDEPGTLFMAASHDDPDGVSNYVIECYKDEKSYKIHAGSPQFAHYATIAKEVIKERDMFELTPQLILTKEKPLKITGKNHHYVVMRKITLVDQYLEKFDDKLQSEMENALVNEDGFKGVVAGNMFDIENEWRILEIFEDKAAYEAHLKTDWHQKFAANTQEMIYDSEDIKLTADTIVDQGELIYR